MSIVSSSQIVGTAQSDGRRYVVETHTDSEGGIHKVEYLSDASDSQLSGFLSARADQIAEQLAEQEANALLGEGG